MKNTFLLVDLFEGLRQSTEKYTEVLENNTRLSASKSFERSIIKTLVGNGFDDLSDDLKKENFENGPQSQKLEQLVGKLETKKSRIEWHKRFRKAVRENLSDLANMIESQKPYVVAQPLGSKRPPDLLIVNNGQSLKISLKTGGGKQPKLNDRPFGQDEIVIFHCNNKKKLGGQITFALGKDIIPLDHLNAEMARRKRLRDLYEKDLQEYPPLPGSVIKTNPRARVDLTKHASDWFGKTINGLDRREREQRVIDHLALL